MSIVNEALKKAGKEFDTIDTSLPSKEHENAEKNWILVGVLALVLVASVFGSMILYKNISKTGRQSGQAAIKNAHPEVQIALNQAEKKVIQKAIKPGYAAKLSGILYGPQNRWAIVNDNIVKEGDNILGGEVVAITKESVKIEKVNGEEVVLNLK